jgi:2'-5' RNA ligase
MTPAAPVLKGYSLWFMPSGSLYRDLSSLISSLASDHGTPVFEPHVTLLGQLEMRKEDVLAKAKLLAARIRPFTIELRNADFQADYFRCLYLEVARTEDILHPYETACRLFDRTPGKFWPHLSLVYGSFPLKTKEKIINGLSLPEKRAFEVRRLHVFATEGAVSDWIPVKGFDLSAR